MITIVAKVTHLCNFGCRYCCVGEGNDNITMSDEIVCKIIETASKFSKHVNIIWHGGEPLIVGLDFYKKVVEYQKLYPNCYFRNSIQTNGSLLTREIVRFFKENKFHIGFSLDGCKSSHNLNRPFKSGKPSFDEVLRGMRLVNEIYDSTCGAICILNKNTLQYLREIYEFSKDSGISFKFNPQYPAGRALVNNDLGLENEETAKALVYLFDLWFNDKGESRAKIHQFESFVKSIVSISQSKYANVKPYDCGFGGKCQNRFIAVSPTGECFPCGKFVNEKGFEYGNILDFDISSYLLNPIRNKILDYSLVNTDCSDCEFRTMCNGGCPNNSYLFYGDIAHPNPFCHIYKTLFQHIKDTLISCTCRKDIFIHPIHDEKSINRHLIYSPLTTFSLLYKRRRRIFH